MHPEFRPQHRACRPTVPSVAGRSPLMHRDKPADAPHISEKGGSVCASPTGSGGASSTGWGTHRSASAAQTAAARSRCTCSPTTPATAHHGPPSCMPTPRPRQAPPQAVRILGRAWLRAEMVGELALQHQLGDPLQHPSGPTRLIPCERACSTSRGQLLVYRVSRCAGGALRLRVLGRRLRHVVSPRCAIGTLCHRVTPLYLQSGRLTSIGALNPHARAFPLVGGPVTHLPGHGSGVVCRLGPPNSTTRPRSSNPGRVRGRGTVRSVPGRRRGWGGR
jgi:hypothetical protein